MTYDDSLQRLPLLVRLRPLAEPPTEEQAEHYERHGSAEQRARSCDREPLHTIRVSAQRDQSRMADRGWEGYHNCQGRTDNA